MEKGVNTMCCTPIDPTITEELMSMLWRYFLDFNNGGLSQRSKHETNTFVGAVLTGVD